LIISQVTKVNKPYFFSQSEVAILSEAAKETGDKLEDPPKFFPYMIPSLILG